MNAAFNVEDFEPLARERLSQSAYDYIAGGAEDEITLAGNVTAFRRHRFRFRVMVDVTERDLSVELLGHRLAFPVILAPTAGHRLVHPDGEAETARGAAAAGALMVLSSIATVPMEEVAAAAPGAPRWFQLYCYGDAAHSGMLVRRAHAAGYTALVATVDVPLLGRRERDLRNPFVLPEGVRFVHFEDHDPAPADGVAALRARARTAGLCWDDVGWLRSLSPLPLIIKGVVRGDDAERAVAAGFDAVWVSNHGGRQLDRSIATADALPEVVAAVGRRVPVIVDGGIRRGTDVLTALALGADAVAVGRPPLWGLAVEGADGVRRVVEMLRDELSLAMALAGCRSLADIGPDLLA